MNSNRIKALARDVSKNDIVLDVGCDHGYLSIYLKENNLCQKVYASDISEKALESARNNFQKHHLKIESFVSDGFQNIPVQFNTAVIAGMGTTSILNILNNEKRPDKLIISSNNEHYKLRKSLNKMGYKIVDERVVKENNHYYLIFLYIKRKQKLSRSELRFGISNNDEYYEYLKSKYQELIPKVPFRKKIILYYYCLKLKGLIEKK